MPWTTMDVDLSIYPNAAHIDYSLTSKLFSSQDLYDEAYFAESYATLPKRTLDPFDHSYFGCSVSSIEFPASVDDPSTSHAASLSGQSELDFASSVNNNSIPDSNVPITPITATPSPFSSHDEDIVTTSSLSSSSPTCKTPSILTSSSDKSIPKRRRGRAKLNCKLSDSISILSAKPHRRASRVSHNQVERKYRDGLNSELEKLRRVVPSLSQSNEGAMIGRPKPTKAMVLSCAIEYIEKIEIEKEVLQKKNEQLDWQIWKKMSAQSVS